MASDEGAIQKAILQYLQLKRYFHWRNNTGASIMQNANGKKRFMRFGTEGSPDIFVIYQGRIYGLEVKDKAKQSESQMKFQQDMERVGGIYAVVRSLEDVKSLGL
jgi:hypothetical protein